MWEIKAIFKMIKSWKKTRKKHREKNSSSNVTYECVHV